MLKISEDEYFFYEWLILHKDTDSEEFSRLSDDEFSKLRSEYEAWKINNGY